MNINVSIKQAKVSNFSFRGLCPLTPHWGLCPWTPIGGSAPSAQYMLARPNSRWPGLKPPQT